MFKYLNFLVSSAMVSASANVSSANPLGFIAAMQLSFTLLLTMAQLISSWLSKLRHPEWQAESRRFRKEGPQNVIQQCIGRGSVMLKAEYADFPGDVATTDEVIAKSWENRDLERAIQCHT